MAVMAPRLARMLTQLTEAGQLGQEARGLLDEHAHDQDSKCHAPDVSPATYKHRRVQDDHLNR
jgi:hypothetical protein